MNPPGPASIPLMAWLLTIFGRPFLRLGGTGDLRAFQTAFRGSLMLTACAALLILTTPFLAYYAAMNVVLFLILFTLGFLTARIAGINFWIQLAYITISAFVGLNPQEPVASQTIIDTFLGLSFGMFIGTVLGRLLLAGIATKSPAKQSPCGSCPDQSVAQWKSSSREDSDATGNSTIRGPTGCSSDSNSHMFAGRKGEACLSGSRATNVNHSDQPFTFSPRHIAGNHRTNTTNTEAAV